MADAAAVAAAATPEAAAEVVCISDRKLHLMLYRDIKNAAELRQHLLSNAETRDMSLINASMVVSKYQVQLSAYKALEAEAANKLTTKTLHAELVYGLAGSTHVGGSLKRCGLRDDTQHVLVAMFDATPDVQAITTLVQGTSIPLDELPQLYQADVIQEAFKLTNEELQIGSLEDAVVVRLAARDC